MIRLVVPGQLEFRDIAVRVIGTACRLLRPRAEGAPAISRDAGDFTQDEFATQVVSAFSEAFNNVAIHGYAGASGDVELLVSSEDGAFVVVLRDTGKMFDPIGYLDLPEELPERGMGLFIIRSFMDDVRYEPGPPNALRLSKRWP